jgi:uncharacterized protein YecE (DUF72 family)
MEVLIGTSGWYYDWNKEKTLDWFIDHSGLGAIELNASFYRFPFPNQVKSWARKGKALRWVIKVNRLITHQYRFSEKAVATWQKFLTLFSEMDSIIDYYLFQLPPSCTAKMRKRIERFLKNSGSVQRCALEPRNASWFSDEEIAWAAKLGITWVSIDAPEFSREIVKTGQNVYVRMHGRTQWYRHNYTDRELEDVAQHIYVQGSKRAYIFFNNNHNMLKNAKKMHAIMNNMKG